MTTNTDDDNIEIIGANPQAATDEDADGKSLTDLVEQPAKVMRIGTMIKQLLEEVRAAPLDDASRNRLRDIHRTSISELEQGLVGFTQYFLDLPEGLVVLHLLGAALISATVTWVVVAARQRSSGSTATATNSSAR